MLARFASRVDGRNDDVLHSSIHCRCIAIAFNYIIKPLVTLVTYDCELLVLLVHLCRNPYTLTVSVVFMNCNFPSMMPTRFEEQTPHIHDCHTLRVCQEEPQSWIRNINGSPLDGRCCYAIALRKQFVGASTIPVEVFTEVIANPIQIYHAKVGQYTSLVRAALWS